MNARPSIWLLLSLVPACAGEPTPARPVRQVILLVADGWGPAHVLVTRDYRSGGREPLSFERFPVREWMETTPTGLGPTDSAAAATALSTGAKTRNGRLGVDPAGLPLRHAVEVAEAAGKRTGVVTSVPFSHATPAGFVVHHPDRNAYEAIAREMLTASAVDVILGCGHPGYDDAGRPLATPKDYSYVGGAETWAALTDADGDGRGLFGADADGDGQPDEWAFIDDLAAFRALSEGTAPARLCGVPRVRRTLQEKRPGNSAEPFGDPRIVGVPTLAELTRAALNVLDDDPDGFFLMVEGGAIDWASHGNRTARMVEEMCEFEEAVRAVVDWVEARGARDETLVIVTGDHETGGLERLPPGEAPRAGWVPPVRWTTKHHTNTPIPLFAEGPGAAWLGEGARARAGALDNTDVGLLLHDVLRAE